MYCFFWKKVIVILYNPKKVILGLNWGIKKDEENKRKFFSFTIFPLFFLMIPSFKDFFSEKCKLSLDQGYYSNVQGFDLIYIYDTVYTWRSVCSRGSSPRKGRSSSPPPGSSTRRSSSTGTPAAHTLYRQYSSTTTTYTAPLCCIRQKYTRCTGSTGQHQQHVSCTLRAVKLVHQQHPQTCTGSTGQQQQQQQQHCIVCASSTHDVQAVQVNNNSNNDHNTAVLYSPSLENSLHSDCETICAIYQ